MKNHYHYLFPKIKLNNDFSQKFKTILKQPRGGGFWIWKFDIIKQKIQTIKHGDILVYLDAGCSINKFGEKRFFEYMELLNSSQNDIISFQMPHSEYKYTTKEIFNYFNIDMNNQIALSGQFVGGILIMKKSDTIINFLDDCLKILETDPKLITDEYNNNEQHKDFIDNRHDQSILSIMRKINGSIIIQEETWFPKFGDSISLKYPFWATRKN